MKHSLHAFILLLGMAPASLSLAQVQSSTPAGRTLGSGLDLTPTRTENFGALFAGSDDWRFPVWQQDGSLIRTRWHSQGDPGVEVFDDSGKLQKEFLLSVPGARDAGVSGATALKDGRIVVGVRAFDSEGREVNLLGVGNDSGNIKLLFRTGPFVIDQMCTGDNDTVWAYGWEEGSHREPIARYKALRQYDLQKGEIQAVLDVPTMSPIAVGVDAVLHCAAGRVFFFDAYYGQLFTYETATGAMSKLAAESLREKTVTFGIVITDSGDLFASIYPRAGASEAKLVRLKRTGSVAQWVPVDSIPKSDFLFASSGDQLILLRHDRFAEFRHIRP